MLAINTAFSERGQGEKYRKGLEALPHPENLSSGASSELAARLGLAFFPPSGKAHIPMAGPITSLDLWDDAIKIGLGGLVGGFFTIVGMLRTQSHDFKKERFRRRQDAIERIAQEFEVADAVMLKTQTEFYCWLEAQRSDVVRELHAKEVRRLMVEEINPAIQKLHEIESRLLVSGFEDCAQAVREVRICGASMQSLVDFSRPRISLDLLLLGRSFSISVSTFIRNWRANIRNERCARRVDRFQERQGIW